VGVPHVDALAVAWERREPLPQSVDQLPRPERELLTQKLAVLRGVHQPERLERARGDELPRRSVDQLKAPGIERGHQRHPPCAHPDRVDRTLDGERLLADPKLELGTRRPPALVVRDPDPQHTVVDDRDADREPVPRQRRPALLLGAARHVQHELTVRHRQIVDAAQVGGGNTWEHPPGAVSEAHAGDYSMMKLTSSTAISSVFGMLSLPRLILMPERLSPVAGTSASPAVPAVNMLQGSVCCVHSSVTSMVTYGELQAPSGHGPPSASLIVSSTVSWTSAVPLGKLPRIQSEMPSKALASTQPNHKPTPPPQVSTGMLPCRAAALVASYPASMVSSSPGSDPKSTRLN